MPRRKFVIPRRRDAALDIDFEADLNEQQLAAVTAGDGPKLVIAGAGTGKTRTLTYRVAWLIAEGLPVSDLLLVTFTNKAAREMVSRVQQLIELDARRLWGGTFHSMGARVLRSHGQTFGLTESFSILDESDQRDLLRVCVTDVGISVERRRFPSPRVLAGLISLHANSGAPIEDVVLDRYPRFADWSDEIVAVAARYVERKRQANTVDYDDLLCYWLRLLEEVPEVREHYGRRFRHILVDEYQDTNRVQGRIVESLAGENGGNLMVVGDDCQSIYAFRGAHYDNILRFPDRNPGTEVFKLETNYRSTPEILALTNASIRCNENQFTKELAAKRPSGELPALVPAAFPDQEAAFVTERILQLRDEGVPFHHIAILYRAHAHRLTVETTLLRHDIPYEVRGGVRFFEQAHIKDVTAYLRLVANPRDEVAFRRTLLLLAGVGNVTADRIRREVTGCSTFADLHAGLVADRTLAHLSGRARRGWSSFVSLLEQVHEAAEDPENAVRCVLAGGYADHAAAQFVNYESRLEDLEQLGIFAAQYRSIGAFLEELVLLGEMYGQDVRGGRDEDETSVVLSTVHQAKGLEWDAVFLIHLVEGALPSPRAVEEEDGEEEERRIFYVAMTRARTELYLSYPIMRPGGYQGTLVQQPSRFLRELPEEMMEVWELSESGAAADSSADPGDPWDGYDPNVDPAWDDEAEPF